MCGFADIGVAVRVISDGGTNLTSAEIFNFFKNWRVTSVNMTLTSIEWPCKGGRQSHEESGPKISTGMVMDGKTLRKAIWTPTLSSRLIVVA